ncbi:MAG: glycosyltransferase, partial [Bdellovibrionota bacterium]
MKKNPKITIIIPTYEREKMLIDCLFAINKQTCGRDKFEVRVIDDATPNSDVKKSKVLANHFDFELSYTVQEKGGPAKARNLGAQNAKGEIIVFLDDDTLPDKEWLSELVKALENSDFDGVGGITENVKNETLSEKLLHHIDHLISPIDPKSGEITFLVTVNAAFYKKAFDEVGGFDEGFKLPSGEDIDLGYRMRTQGFKFGHARKALVYHHQRDTLKSMFKNWYNYGQGIYRCQVKH